MPFASIVGHARQRALLSRAIARASLPPALLFSGPAGVGKRLVAQSVAQSLNCLDPQKSDALPLDACGVCAACSKIARGVHPDALFLTPDDKGSIVIETVRDVIDRAGYRPFEGRRRVVVIDEADAMTTQAQNALLKTLEEPPSASVFLLVASRPDALLPTVRSRCPRLRFAELSPGEIAAVLVRDHEYNEQEARAAAAASDGTVATALALQTDDAEQVVDARELLTLALRSSDLQRRVQAVRDFFPKKSTPAADRDYLAARLRALASLLRDLSIVLTEGPRELLANSHLEGELRKLAGSCDVDRAARGYAAVDQALAALERNASAKVVADWLVVHL